MARHIDADKVIEEISRLANRSMVGEIDEPYLDWKTVVSVIFDAPTADVVPKSEYEELKQLLDATIAGQETLQKALANAKSEVAREIFGEFEEALQYEIDLEDKNGRNAWGQGDVRTFQTHQYTEDKLETILVALSLFKKKYTEGEK